MPQCEVTFEADGVAVLRMNAPPVNVMSTAFFREFRAALATAEARDDVQALVLTSALPKVYSAGLNLLEMHKRSRDVVRAYWSEFQQTWLAFYTTRLATIAAVEGAALAGGCIFALSCDYRVGSTTCRMGLNETQVGMVIPSWLRAMVVRSIGSQAGDRIMMLGNTLSAEESLQCGILQRLVAPEDLVPQALAVARVWAKVPAHARVGTKHALQVDVVNVLRGREREDQDETIGFLENEVVQATFARVLATLARRGPPSKM